MLPDLSPAHVLIVIVVALIVVGPQDLPKLLRKIGQFMGRMRGMANEFRASFDEMARQSELDELRKEVEAMRKASTGALTQDFGVDAALRSEAESTYMSQWAQSHGAPTDAVTVEADTNSILPPAAEAPKPAKTSKPKTPKPKAPAAKSAKPKSEAKPRAKKAKPEAEA